MAKVQQWDEAKAREELVKRLKNARKYREQFESQWRDNESVLFSATGSPAANYSVSFNSLAELMSGEEDTGDSVVGMNYAWRYLRFLLSQMSANPPSVVPSPTSPDIDDRRAADAADRLIRYWRKHLQTQEIVDLWSLNVLTYGTGWIKEFWDPNKGDARDFDKSTNELTMSGDIDIYAPSTWDVWADPDVKKHKDIRYTFERKCLSVEEALFRWPDQKDLIEAARVSKTSKAGFWSGEDSKGYESQKDLVEVYEYYEKALPWNGMAGRYVVMLEQGEFLEPMRANPQPGGRLPYHILTDVDVPDQIYGKSFIDYIIRLQDILNKLDSTVLDNIQSHGVARLVLPDGAEIEDESVSNSAWDWIKISGGSGQAPFFVNPPALMPDIQNFRQQLIIAMDALAGVNESMLGDVKRELSGYAVQTAINAGNLVRRRLFNKFTMGVEDFYSGLLALAQQEWKEKKLISVLGKEMAFESVEISGADLKHGFALIVEYGASLSLDPERRREEIMQLSQLFKEAGVPPRTILSMLKLNELSNLHDLPQLARLRQQEIFDEMIAKYDTGLDAYIAPEDLEEHQGMLETAYQFRMSASFKYLDKPLRDLIDRHIRDREAMAAKGAAGGSGGTIPQASPAGGPAEAALAGLPGMGAGIPPILPG